MGYALSLCITNPLVPIHIRALECGQTDHVRGRYINIWMDGGREVGHRYRVVSVRRGCSMSCVDRNLICYTGKQCPKKRTTKISHFEDFLPFRRVFHGLRSMSS